MNFLDVFIHFIYFFYFKYIRFSGFSDKKHLKISCDLLETEYVGNSGVIKEINVFGIKSSTCLKSTAYYIELHSKYPELFKNTICWDYSLSNIPIDLNQNGVFNWCQLYFSTLENHQFKEINTYAIRTLETDLKHVKIVSIHIQLLNLKYDFHRNKIDKLELEQKTIEIVKEQSVSDLMTTNSFVVGKKSTSHEMGYLLEILLDIYEHTKSRQLLIHLDYLMEKIHSIFVSKKVIYSKVIGKGGSINVSGILLIAKTFLRYSLIEKDYRYASAAYFLIDIVKNLQKLNLKNLVSNTFPIYRFGSPYKYPAWTLCYFIKALCLKSEVQKIISNEASISI